MTMGWDSYFLTVADAVATKSKDQSTKVGAVIVDGNKVIRATGYNGFPRGIADTAERLNDRAVKYSLITHAETNAILAAARVGVPLDGCTLYCTMHPCSRCAGLIIQAGIKRVGFTDAELPERWLADCELALSTMQEAGVFVWPVEAA